MSYPRFLRERIKTIRGELIALDASEVDLPKCELDAVLDAWDSFEYAAQTAEGCEQEVVS